MNKAWHKANPLPSNATRDERIVWHAAHVQACRCRPVPTSLREDVRRYLEEHPNARREPS